MRHLATITACAVAACAVAASAGARPQALSPAAFRADAATTCVDANKQITHAMSSARPGDELLNAGRAYLAALRQLQPPASFAAMDQHVDSIVAAEISRLAVLDKKYDAGAITIKELADDKTGLKLSAEESAVWQQLGVKACV